MSFYSISGRSSINPDSNYYAVVYLPFPDLKDARKDYEESIEKPAKKAGVCLPYTEVSINPCDPLTALRWAVEQKMQSYIEWWEGEGEPNKVHLANLQFRMFWDFCDRTIQEQLMNSIQEEVQREIDLETGPQHYDVEYHDDGPVNRAGSYAAARAQAVAQNLQANYELN